MRTIPLMVAAMLLTVAFGAGAALAVDVERVTAEELSANLDSGMYVVVDVRRGSDWKGSELKIKGAVRLDPRNVTAGAADLPKGKELVLYCA